MSRYVYCQSNQIPEWCDVMKESIMAIILVLYVVSASSAISPQDMFNLSQELKNTINEKGYFVKTIDTPGGGGYINFTILTNRSDEAALFAASQYARVNKVYPEIVRFNLKVNETAPTSYYVLGEWCQNLIYEKISAKRPLPTNGALNPIQGATLSDNFPILTNESMIELGKKVMATKLQL